MKVFFKNLGFILLILLCSLYILDLAYTYSYKNPIYPRNTVSWLKSGKLIAEKYDYILFGSSRCAYTINPKQILKETGLHGVNLGYSSCNAFEIKLMVKDFLKEHHTNKIFIQVDHEFNNELTDVLAIVPWMPFVKELSIYEDILKVDKTIKFKKIIPFYRYMYYDSELGFRNLVLSFFKPNSFELKDGFVPINGSIKEDLPSVVYNLENKENIHFKEIIAICKEKNVEVNFFTAPYYNSKINSAVFEKNLPNYTNFSASVESPYLFKDNSHLNVKGAKMFTTIFSNSCLRFTE